jgi:hypothetical protein
MSRENRLWGAPRIHGELLKLGFEVAESTVSKYMIRHRGPPSQTWRTFLRNHADAIAAIDLCVVHTATFERLFALIVIGHGRRQLLWFAVTRHPTAEWLAQQLVEAFPWDTAPTYLVRDNDRAYGQVFLNRLRSMGIRDRPTAPTSPWQNPYVERLIGTLSGGIRIDSRLREAQKQRRSRRLSVYATWTVPPQLRTASSTNSISVRTVEAFGVSRQAAAVLPYCFKRAAQTGRRKSADTRCERWVRQIGFRDVNALACRCGRKASPTSMPR